MAEAEMIEVVEALAMRIAVPRACTARTT